MSEPQWNGKKKKEPWFNKIYEELERLGDLVDKTVQKAFETSSEKPLVNRTRIKGFCIKIFPDGKPMIKEINKPRSRQKKTKVNEELEPLFDLIEDAETIIVLASLPGVKRDALHLCTTETRLTFSVDTPNLRCHKELKFPARVDPKSAHAVYKNGVLQVKLKKLNQSIIKDKISVKK